MPRTPASRRSPKIRLRRSATTATAVARKDAWLAAHRRAMWLSLALLAIAACAVYVVQLDSGPLIELHRLTETDMN